MPLLKIGNRYINTDNVINFDANYFGVVDVYHNFVDAEGADAMTSFSGNEADALLRWLDANATDIMATLQTALLPHGTIVKITGQRNDNEGVEGVITHVDEGDTLPYRVVPFGDGHDELDWIWCSRDELTVIRLPKAVEPESAPVETPRKFKVGDKVHFWDDADDTGTVLSIEKSAISGQHYYLTTLNPDMPYYDDDLEPAE